MIRSALLKPIFTAAAIFIVYVGLFSAGVLDIPALKTRDLFFKLRHNLSSNDRYTKDIVIIQIDDSSYAGRWAWSRHIFAYLTYELNTYKPAVIGYDLGFFDESTTLPASDLLFSEALRNTGNVILASYLDKDGWYITPAKEFKENALSYGFTNKPEDIDNVIRDTRLFIKNVLSNDIMDYSFDIKVAAAFLKNGPNEINFNGREITCGNMKVAVGTDGCLALNFTAKLSDFKTVTFAQIAENKVSLDFIKGKIVLIGVTDPVFHDISLTPLGRMTGVTVLANSVSMIINNNFLHRIPYWINLIILFIFGLTASLFTSKKGIIPATIAALILLAVSIALSMALIANNFLWDFFGIPALILSIYIINNVLDYTELFIQSMKVKKIATTDPFTGLSTRRFFLIKLERILKTLTESDSAVLILFGIDNFDGVVAEIGAEKINDIIKEIGAHINKSSRKTRQIDIVSRYGEGEFASFLNKTSLAGAVAYTERIQQIKTSGGRPITLSAGIVSIKDIKYRLAKVFVKSAETALSRARQEGRAKIIIYDPKKDLIHEEKLKEEKEISEVDLSYVASEFQEKHKELAILLNKVRIAHEDVLKSERISSVGKVAASIHHDLSKPIINLRSSLKMIKDDLNKIQLAELETSKKLVSSAVEETERLIKLADRLRDLYKPLKKEIIPVQVNPVLEEMLGFTNFQMNKNKIELIKNISQGLPDVSADPDELKQVFLNLIINAIEAMPAGGRLEVTTSLSIKKKDTVEIKVKDTGCGIAPENIDKLFKAFFSTKKDDKGAGLGLYASLEIVKKYGGDIEIESAVNQGSAFTVCLPVYPISPLPLPQSFRSQGQP